MMRFKKYSLFTLLVAVTVIAILLAVFVERKAVIGQSSTSSPDGNWSLDLRLVEYSTFFASHRILDAEVRHSKNKDWSVASSIPLKDADGRTISNQRPDHPIVWSDDSTTVKYWINDEFEDSIKIEADDERHFYQRKLLSTTVINGSKK